jgi:hypothetical protein
MSILRQQGISIEMFFHTQLRHIKLYEDQTTTTSATTIIQ